ncbi:hypothetical protein GY45DRAFT_1332175 [Cubamyces sp. BRFM 1775]|nr:hypothetical protein GY45DRAFT_1332175 [Cubamyces sp. BRFM 1775]
MHSTTFLTSSFPSYLCSAVASRIYVGTFASYLSPLRTLLIAPTIHIPPSLRCYPSPPSPRQHIPFLNSSRIKLLEAHID